MDSNSLTPFEPRDLPHPGESVVEYLDVHGWSQSDLARRTRLTPKTISGICNGKAPITPPTALALEKVFQRPARFWLNLQRQYDEVLARKDSRMEAAEWKDWTAAFPLKEMRKLGFFKQLPGQSDTDALLSFLGVSSPDSWRAVWNASHVAFRQTRRFKTSDEAISAWVRATEIEAAALVVAPYDEKLLRASLEDLRRLSMIRADKIMEPVTKICGSAGVAVVWVPELPHIGMSGCARWLTSTKALVALSLRYKTDDQMWFTFFHELGHILLHRKTRDFVLDNAFESLSDNIVDPEIQKCEEEANAFARDTLIPPAELAAFIRRGDFGNEAVKGFAAELEIGPGILVGRLQHDGILEPHQGNAFKQRLDFRIEEDT